MHKGTILLLKADDRSDAISVANDFMEGYHGSVYDYYTIGGSWEDVLAPADKVKEFKEWAEIEFPDYFSNRIRGGLTDRDKAILQLKWEKIGLKGKHRYSTDNFSPDGCGPYCARPLPECMQEVIQYKGNTEQEIEEAWNSMIEAKKEEEATKASGGIPGTMSCYYAGIYHDLGYKNFSFDSNVYDVYENESEHIPDDPDGYWAVVVDMHS